MNPNSDEEAWTPKQNRGLGWFCCSIGLFLFVGALLPAAEANAMEKGGGALILLSLAMFFGGGALIVRGKRHLTRDGVAMLARDPRPPVIYLRSFGAETRDYGLRSKVNAFFINFTNRSLPLGTSWWLPTFQAQLASLLNRVGPYVAIGRPGERLPGMGAARLYVSDAEWQSRVEKLLSQAVLVVLRAGTTKGLNWEVRTLRNLVKPEQVLIILPFWKKEYQVFRELLQAEADVDLPEKQPGTLLLTFGEDWKPLPLDAPGELQTLLRPYFLQNGLQPPKSRWWDSLTLFFR